MSELISGCSSCPIVLFGMSASCVMPALDQIAGDGLGDLLIILAGVSLVVQCIFLYHRDDTQSLGGTMPVDWRGLFALLGLVSIAIAMIVMALLSKRLGSVTQTPRYYLGFYVAAGLMAISILVRLLNIGRGDDIADTLGQDPVSVLLYVGLPASPSPWG